MSCHSLYNNIFTLDFTFSNGGKVLQFIINTKKENEQLFVKQNNSDNPCFPKVVVVNEGKADYSYVASKWKLLSRFIEERGFNYDYTKIAIKICEEIKNNKLYKRDKCYPILSTNSIFVYADDAREEFEVRICFLILSDGRVNDQLGKGFHKPGSVYAIGSLLYEMLFREVHTSNTINKHIGNDGLVLLIDKCLSDTQNLSIDDIIEILNDSEFAFPYNRYRIPSKYYEKKTGKVHENLIGKMKRLIDGINGEDLLKIANDEAIFKYCCDKMIKGDGKDLDKYDPFNAAKGNDYINVKLMIKFGCYYEDKKEEEKALQRFDRAIEYGYPEAYNCKGMLLYRKNKKDDALKCFGDAINIFTIVNDKKIAKKIPAYAEAQRNIGFIRKENRMPPEEYLDNFEEASLIFPNNYIIEKENYKKGNQIIEKNENENAVLKRNMDVVNAYDPEGKKKENK